MRDGGLASSAEKKVEWRGTRATDDNERDEDIAVGSGPGKPGEFRGRAGAGQGGADFARRGVGGAAHGDGVRVGRKCVGRGSCGTDF